MSFPRIPARSITPVLRASFSSSSSLAAPKTKAPKAISSCPAGTPLSNLSILKDKPDPVALPDDQYPAWLWTLLDEPAAPSNAKDVSKTESGSVDDLKAQKKTLKALNRENIKASNYLKSTT
ncbi:hypothetical protein IAR50_005634 [Cryptococcus sp. DSM 104548]